MTIERPMFPPRAESMDSFSCPSAIGGRAEGRPLSDSPKPARGLSRRLLLAGLAAMPAAQPSAASVSDPVFALITEKRAADAAFVQALDEYEAAEERHGFGSDEAEEVSRRSEAPGHAAWEAGWCIAKTQPTTVAGIIAMLRFANEFEDAGNEWPGTGAIGPNSWHYQLRETTAQALEAIIRQGVA